MKNLALINPENVSEQEAEKYQIREAARAVVFDDDKLVALLHVTKNSYYKLPGGGIERGETKEEALKRECAEEIGCNVEIIKEVGLVVEYRKKFRVKQISYCYITRLDGKKGEPKLEKDEIEDGFETVWLSLAVAIKKVEKSKPTVYEGPYMVARDLILLKEVSKMNK